MVEPAADPLVQLRPGAAGTFPGIAGKGGTQTAGGAAGSDPTGSWSHPGYGSVAGSQYTGGHPAGLYAGGGGGGGYFGGGGGDYYSGTVIAGGGGGSGYVGGVSSGTLLSGLGSSVANNTDPDYASGIGVGGNGAAGGHGRIVINWGRRPSIPLASRTSPV